MWPNTLLLNDKHPQCEHVESELVLLYHRTAEQTEWCFLLN